MEHQRAAIVDSISRRKFLKLATALGLTTAVGASGLLTACAPRTKSADSKNEPVQLTQFIWVGGGQGITPREVKREYERDHPWVTIDLLEGTNTTTYGKMVSQKEVDPNKPLVNFGFFNAKTHALGVQDDMWVSLDPKKIPHMNDVAKGYWQSENKGICWGMVPQTLMYNSELVKEPPTSWLDIFDPRFKGKVALWDYQFDINGLSALAHMNGGDWNAAFERFSTAAKDGQFRYFFDSNQMARDGLVQGEILLTTFGASNAINWGPKGEGAPIAYAVPKEGVIALPLLFEIVKGSTPAQIAVAEEIIDLYLSPEQLGRFCSLTKFVPTSLYVKLDASLALEPAFDAAVMENAIQPDFAYLAAHNTELKDRWDREVKAYM